MNQDFKDLLAEFNAHEVKYLVIGAYALAVHGKVRATKDLDLWVQPEMQNAQRTLRALHAFGAPLHDLSEEDLTRPGTVFQIGVAPLRIDVVTAIDGVEFEEAWKARLRVDLAGLSVWVLSREHLLANKRATGRPQDSVDAQWLEENP
ncbi:MAG: nucleotidyl transferase AbiEii/AbiGii toxin family protein [Acidobacteriota bacterium]